MEADGPPIKRTRANGSPSITGITTTTAEEHNGGEKKQNRKNLQTSYWPGQKVGSSRPNKSNSGAWMGRGKRTVHAAGIQSGDVGIFVTCDKGLEKKCLRELEDLLEEYMNIPSSGDAEETEGKIVESSHEADNGVAITATTNNDDDAPRWGEGEDIEADILAELAEMQKPKRLEDRGGDRGGGGGGHEGLGLVTLDIPCVSFVRFPPTTPSTTSSSAVYDPVRLVHAICTDAASEPHRQRSRFIKRLTPISLVRKVLNGGIETLCEEVLPRHFGDGESREAHGYKYAIRPTIRNNNQLNRDQVIRSIAERVEALGGEGRIHKVDLTGYDKLVLVDVYRNVCGMSVVGADYERLKRYNLAEIYAVGRVEMVDTAGVDARLGRGLDRGQGVDGREEGRGKEGQTKDISGSR